MILTIRQINNFMTKTKINNKMLSIMMIKSKINIKKSQKRRKENQVGLHLLLLLRPKEIFNNQCNKTKIYNSHQHLIHHQINLVNKNSIYRINKILCFHHNLVSHLCLQVCLFLLCRQECLYLLSHRKCLVAGQILVIPCMQCPQYLVCQDNYHRHLLCPLCLLNGLQVHLKCHLCHLPQEWLAQAQYSILMLWSLFLHLVSFPKIRKNRNHNFTIIFLSHQ